MREESRVADHLFHKVLDSLVPLTSMWLAGSLKKERILDGWLRFSYSLLRPQSTHASYHAGRIYDQPGGRNELVWYHAAHTQVT